MIAYFKILRINQWYKNIVIFLPLFFAGELFYTNIILPTIIGFLSLCLVSSANYVLNDIVDSKRDMFHPEKKSRPLASKTITILEALILLIMALLSGLIIAFFLEYRFFIAVIILFILTTIYTLWLKKEPIIDIILIATNFVIRAISGALITSILISPWLIVCPFFVAILLGFGKRASDLKLLKNKAADYKEVLKKYTPELINSLMIISTTCLIMAYSLYALSKNGWLLITLPFATYTIFRYYQLVNEGSEISRSPEKFYKDYRLVISLIMWTITLFLIMYLIPHNILTIFLK